jgi:hypothetical protein
VRQHTSELRVKGRSTYSATIGEQILYGMSYPYGGSQKAEHVFAPGPSNSACFSSKDTACEKI